MTEPSSPLAQTLLNTSRRMALELQDIRSQNNHEKVKGDRGEETVRRFLRERLPQSVGVTSGEIIDANGKRSREVDVIVYDAMNSPLVFAGDIAGSVLIPAEAVIAAVEVKFKLRSHHISDLIRHCRSIKSLSRTAYSVPRQAHRSFVPRPIHYSVFAFESEGLYHERFNELQHEVPVVERVDMLTAIDRGFVMHMGMDWVRHEGVFSAHAESQTVFGAVEDPNRALMFWYGFLCTIIGESNRVPMSINPYFEGDLAVNAELEPKDIQRLKDQGAEAMAREFGISPEIPNKVLRDEYVSTQELEEARQSGLIVEVVEETDAGFKISLDSRGRRSDKNTS